MSTIDMKEKQIEEMAHEIFEHFNCRVRAEEAERIAKHLVVTAGYRKQSVDRDTNVLTKWISVEDRLPGEEGWYLVYTAPNKNHKSFNKAEFRKGFEWNGFEPYWRGAGGTWGNVTHWMPLPDAPKKGE